MNPVSLRHELRLKREGFRVVAGVDEVGIGPLAGPVVAACVILNEKVGLLDDSKKLSAKKRNQLFNKIVSHAHIGIGIVDNAHIDSMNILRASQKAMALAVRSIPVRPDALLVDGIRTLPGVKIRQIAIKHGDAISSSLAAASIIAKVIRDALMDDYDVLYPRYGFSEHKGYGTKLHISMLRKYGPCAIHRLSYEPVRAALKRKGLMLF